MAWRVPEEDSGELFAALESSALAERRREEMAYRHHEGAELPADWESWHERLAARIRQGYDRDYVAGLGFAVVAR
jgi:hypothetical protein